MALNDKPKKEKTCAKCGETKPLKDFPPHASRLDGKNRHCRSCFSEMNKQRYAKGREVKEGFFNPNEPMF